MVKLFLSIAIICLAIAWFAKQPVERRAKVADFFTKKLLRLPWQPSTQRILGGIVLTLFVVSGVLAYRHVTRPLEVVTMQLPNHRPIAEDLHPDAPRIGIVDERLRPENARMVGLEPGMGIYVGGVSPNSPAALAGIQRGDIITQMDGKLIQSQHYLIEQCKLKSPGDRINLLIARGQLGREYRLVEDSITYHSITVRLGQRGKS